MSGCEKKEKNKNTHNISSIKRVTGKFLAEFHVVAVQDNCKEMYKNVCCTCKVVVVVVVFFLLIRTNGFVLAVFVPFAAYQHYMILYFV